MEAIIEYAHNVLQTSRGTPAQPIRAAGPSSSVRPIQTGQTPPSRPKNQPLRPRYPLAPASRPGRIHIVPRGSRPHHLPPRGLVAAVLGPPLQHGPTRNASQPQRGLAPDLPLEGPTSQRRGSQDSLQSEMILVPQSLLREIDVDDRIPAHRDIPVDPNHEHLFLVPKELLRQVSEEPSSGGGVSRTPSRPTEPNVSNSMPSIAIQINASTNLSPGTAGNAGPTTGGATSTNTTPPTTTAPSSGPTTPTTAAPAQTTPAPITRTPSGPHAVSVPIGDHVNVLDVTDDVTIPDRKKGRKCTCTMTMLVLLLVLVILGAILVPTFLVVVF